jgi:WD40 repeat protein
MQTLKASSEGLVKIKLAREKLSGENGWAIEDECWLEKASDFLPPTNTRKGETEGSVSIATWKRFLGGKQSIKATSFKAFCSVLGLNWEEVVDLPPRLQTDKIPLIENNSATTHTSNSFFSHQDWGDAPELSSTSFYGRDEEISTLEEWILSDRCRLIAILGIGGIGKTKLSIKFGKGGIGKSALSMKVAEQIQGDFKYVIWRSLLSEPSAQYILDDLLKFLSSQQETNPPEIVSDKISRLLDYLRKYRCLIILDNAESLLRGSERAGQYKDGFEDYGTLFRKLGEVEHQSCVILTSREKPLEIALLEGKTRPVRSLHLGGLDELEGRKIIEDNGSFSGTDEEWKALIKFYDGNPLALDIVSRHILWTFDGNVSRFLEIGKNVFGDLRDLLNWHFERLSDSEKEIMYWFAISREPISIELLQEKILSLDSKEKVAESLHLLGRRLPIEKSITGFTLQPVLIEYMIEQLIQQTCREIKSAKPTNLNSHTLIEAQAKNYIRESQERLIIQPIINIISQEISKDFLIQQLNKIILRTQKKNINVGYIGGNIINLLNYTKVDLSTYDFSKIPIWQAYLQGIDLHGVNFAYCNFSKTVFTQTFGSISSVQYSPDGRYFAVGHTKNEISIWQVSDGQQISICKGHTNWVQSIAFSLDGEFLASGSEDGSIKLWEVQSGACLETFLGHNNKVLAIAFSPDGDTLASGGGDHTIKFWNVHNGQCLKTLAAHSDWIFSINFSHNGEILASGSGDNTIKLWEIDDYKCFKTLEGHTRGIKSVAFSPNSEFLASGSFDRTISLWDAKNGQCIKTFRDHVSQVLAVAFSPDNQILASSSSDKTIRLWDITSGKCTKILQGHNSHVWSIAYSCDGQNIISGSGDQTVRVWQTQDAKCLKILQGCINSLWSVAYESSQKLIAAGCEDGSIRIWDSQINKFRKSLQDHKHIVWSVAFSPDGKVLASGSGDKTVKLWNLESEECTRTLIGHKNTIRSIAFSPDGKTLASAGDDQDIRLWAAKTGKCTQVIRGNIDRIRSVTFSPDGKLLANGNELYTINLWQVESGKCLKTLEGHTGAIQTVRFSPDSQSLVSSSSDRSATLWDINSGEIIRVLDGHTNGVEDVCFSPDGKYLATCSVDQTIRLWDAQTGETLEILEGHTNSVCSITFGFNDQNLIIISGSEDETIRFWDIQTGDCVKVLNIPRPYEGMNITGVKGVTEAQIDTLKALGAVEIGD